MSPAKVSPARAVAPESNVRQLVVLAQRRLTGEPPKRSAASLEGLEQRFARWQRGRRTLFGAIASGLLGVACVLCLLLANRGEALRVEVLSGSARESGPDDCALLRFSDGSEVAIGAGALWRLRAGDYRMDGNGTSFDIDFEPDRQSLDIDLASGSLFVTGPAFQAAVQAGEHLAVQLGRGEASLERRGLVARCSPRDAEPERENQ